jgi:hypothetical protein
VGLVTTASRPFVITAAASSINLDAAGAATSTITVTNTLGRPVTARAMIRAEQPLAMPWFTLQGDPELPLAVNQAHQFNVSISVPAGAPAGTYEFLLNVVGVENPDEISAQGPSITVNVAPSVAPPKPQPWPWIIAAIVVALVIIAVGAFVALRRDDDHAQVVAATPPPNAATVAPRPPRPVLSEGAGSREVQQLQEKLRELGLRPETGGRFGPQTTQAVREFQRSRGIDPTGVVDAETWAALGFTP